VFYSGRHRIIGICIRGEASIFVDRYTAISISFQTLIQQSPSTKHCQPSIRLQCALKSLPPFHPQSALLPLPTLILLRRAGRLRHSRFSAGHSIHVSGSGQRLRSDLLLSLLLATLAELVDARVVDLVLPGLVEVDEEDDVVAQRG